MRRRPIVPVYRRRVGGRKESRARPGLVPVLFFALLCLAAAALGLIVERKLQTTGPAPPRPERGQPASG